MWLKGGLGGRRAGQGLWLCLLMGLLFPPLLLVGGCATEKSVLLTYERLVNVTGGTGEIYLARPGEKFDAVMLPGGRMILGKARDTDADVVTRQSVPDWIVAAFAEELRGAGYVVHSVTELPKGVGKGLKTSVLALSADQYIKVLTLSTVVEIKLAVEIWRSDELVKTVTAQAREEREGLDRSSEPIRLALEKTLQRVMQELMPDVVTNLR